MKAHHPKCSVIAHAFFLTPSNDLGKKLEFGKADQHQNKIGRYIKKI